jgi:uncharacterized protein (TIGR02646 family)
MRPVDRGPNATVYRKYEDAKQDLVNRLGCYCSYCERRIATLLAVEHIQPKARPEYTHLEKVWDNFLLGCVNCNSAKSKKPVDLASYLIPDRDNTFSAFAYDDLGMVNPAAGLSPELKKMAEDTCELVALNRMDHEEWDEDVIFSALERAGQRVQAWTQAREALADYQADRTVPRRIAAEAASCGFFSIWMAAFENYPEVRLALISTFPNTAADCFDPVSTVSVSPRPASTLANGSKI